MAEVVVVGSFMMDLVVRGPRRPERGETVIGTSFETFLGGKGFNQAVAAARAGASTAMVGRLGDDDFGRQFIAQLGRDGIDATHVGLDGDSGTGVGLPFVEDSGDNSIVVIPRANHALTVQHVRDAADVIAAARVLLLQMELPLEPTIEAARIAHDAGVTVVLNPAPAVHPLEPFAGLVDYVTPNESEAAQLGTMEATFVTTVGERGVDVGGEHIDGYEVDCIDSVGAGDAFCGAFAAALAGGAALLDAAGFGNAAGALAVGVAGAEPSMPRRADIDRLVRSRAIIR